MENYFALMHGLTRATLQVEDYLTEQAKERAINKAVERDRDASTQPQPEGEHEHTNRD